ncbi:hypothetical protein PCL_07486 [Purpureocillium lilacinum]|uniref:Uncharacterized protein n=1 Tax=Purpureocillium lilacinum TaxID=33203 RepID=A0A2U3EI66_PURLI|nr:hypothetical protein Purlil1_2514 [Purpureocillium lilacinum]PWI74172.1 hypothetical protein PCL_07486 [Purpureocillium lilacinum]
MHTERNTTHKGSQREPARVWCSSPIARYGRQGTDATGHGKVVCVSSLSTLASRSAEDDAVRRPCWAEMKQPNPLRQMTPDGIQPVLRAFAANRGLSIHLYEPAGTQYAPFPLRRHTLARPCWLSSPGPANRGSPEIASAAQLTVPFVDGRPIGSLLPRARRHSRAVQRSDRRLLQRGASRVRARANTQPAAGAETLAWAACTNGSRRLFCGLSDQEPSQLRIPTPHSKPGVGSWATAKQAQDKGHLDRMFEPTLDASAPHWKAQI